MTKLVEKDNGVQVNSDNIGVLVHPGETPAQLYTTDIILDYEYKYVDVQKGPWVQIVIGYNTITTGVISQNTGLTYTYTGEEVDVNDHHLYVCQASGYDPNDPPQYVRLGTEEDPTYGEIGSGSWLFTLDTYQYVDEVTSAITQNTPITEYGYAQAVTTQNGYYYYWTGEVVSGVWRSDLNVMQAFNYDPETPPQYLRLGTPEIGQGAPMLSLEDGSGPFDMISKAWIEGPFIYKNDTDPGTVYNANYGSYTYDSNYIYNSEIGAIGLCSGDHTMTVSDMDFQKSSVVEEKQTWTGTIEGSSAFGDIILYTANDMPAQGSNAYEDPGMTVGQTIKSTVVVDVPPTPIAVNCVVSYSVDGTTWTEHPTVLTDKNNVICNIPRYMYLKFSQDVEITEE